MAFFDELKERATDLAQSGVAKSKQLMEAAKLKAANMAEEDAIKKAYVEIGKLYYAEKGAAPEGAYAAACQKIAAAKQTIEDNNAKLAELKAAGTAPEVEIEVEIEVEKSPVEEAPAEAPVEEAPVEEAPAGEQPNE